MTETNQLAMLIEAHQTAWAGFENALEREDALQVSTRELFVPLSLGGGQSAHVGDDLEALEAAIKMVRSGITERYWQATSQASKALGRVSRALAEQAIKALRKAQADDLRAMRRLFHEHRQALVASGYLAAGEQREEANQVEKRALAAIVSYRCRSMDEIAAKAAYLMAVTDLHAGSDQIDVDLLLPSMLAEA